MSRSTSRAMARFSLPVRSLRATSASGIGLSRLCVVRAAIMDCMAHAAQGEPT